MTEAYLRDILWPAMEERFLALAQIPMPVETAVSEVLLPLSLEEAILASVRLLGRQGRLMDAPEEAPQPAMCTFLGGKLSPCLLLLSVEETAPTQVRVTACAAAGILPRPGRAQSRADEAIKALILENRTKKRA